MVKQLLMLVLLFSTSHCRSSPVRKRISRSTSDPFVQAGESRFLLNNRPFFVNGYNAYWLALYSYQLETRPHVTGLFQEAAALGLNVARTWAFKDGAYQALQVSPGVYDEEAFRGLDFVIAEAQSYESMLILSLSNNYNDYGGKAQYVQWARNAGHSVDSDDAFFYHPVIRGYYKDYLKAVLTRVNTITGVAYRDDPTIFSWELMNEPRCAKDPSGDTLLAWVEEMSSFVKSLDSNHMLEIGLEGFYNSTNLKRAALDDWSAQLGSDFVRHNQLSSIDFATVHSYPDLWLPQQSFDSQLAFLEQWTRNHVEDATYKLHKPVLFTEFGKSSRSPGFLPEQRDKFFATTYSSIFATTGECGPGAGALLWQLLPDSLGQELDDGFGICPSLSPSTVSVISSQSERVTTLNSRRLNFRDLVHALRRVTSHDCCPCSSEKAKVVTEQVIYVQQRNKHRELPAALQGHG